MSRVTQDFHTFYLLIMTFLWADVEFNWSPITFRYYNDLIWYVYSVLGMIPLFMFGSWKFYLWMF